MHPIQIILKLYQKVIECMNLHYLLQIFFVNLLKPKRNIKHNDIPIINPTVINKGLNFNQIKYLFISSFYLFSAFNFYL